eukprot:TRINITY_DN1293_c0_g1_i1.p1 TRINITY_DN1293_c0_g1~~TRINITY_DN1293_c0_g1_i1.p1  ORF type:complete len:250 (+),score=57.38 TRINITY_DN1293_c0_g1_i1:38-787(+)
MTNQQQALEQAMEKVVKLAKDNKEIAAGVASVSLLLGGLALKSCFSKGNNIKAEVESVMEAITVGEEDSVKLLEKVDGKGRRLVVDSDHPSAPKGLKVDAVNGRRVTTVAEVREALQIRPPTEGTQLTLGEVEVQLKPVAKPVVEAKEMEKEILPPLPEPKEEIKEASPEPVPVAEAPSLPVPEKPVSEVETSVEPSPVPATPEPSTEPEHDESKPTLRKPSKTALKAGGKKTLLKRKPSSSVKTAAKK